MRMFMLEQDSDDFEKSVGKLNSTLTATNRLLLGVLCSLLTGMVIAIIGFAVQH